MISAALALPCVDYDDQRLHTQGLAVSLRTRLISFPIDCRETIPPEAKNIFAISIALVKSPPGLSRKSSLIPFASDSLDNASSFPLVLVVI